VRKAVLMPLRSEPTQRRGRPQPRHRRGRGRGGRLRSRLRSWAAAWHPRHVWPT